MNTGITVSIPWVVQTSSTKLDALSHWHVCTVSITFERLKPLSKIDERESDIASNRSEDLNYRLFCRPSANDLTCRTYSHPTSVLTLALALKRNTLVSIASFTPSVSINVTTSIQIQMGPGLIQQRQRLCSVWTQFKHSFFSITVFR